MAPCAFDEAASAAWAGAGAAETLVDSAAVMIRQGAMEKYMLVRSLGILLLSLH